MTNIKRAAALAMAITLTTSLAMAKGGHGGGSHAGSHTSGSRAGSSGEHATRGYTKKNGTYVAPSHATNPNKTKRDNYSSKGNVNPHTGKEGTKDPDAPKK